MLDTIKKRYVSLSHTLPPHPPEVPTALWGRGDDWERQGWKDEGAGILQEICRFIPGIGWPPGICIPPIPGGGCAAGGSMEISSTLNVSSAPPGIVGGCP